MLGLNIHTNLLFTYNITCDCKFVGTKTVDPKSFAPNFFFDIEGNDIKYLKL